MRSTKWILALAVGVFMLTGNGAMAQGNGNGHGNGHDKHDAGDDQEDRYYKDRDRETRAVYASIKPSPAGARQERPFALIEKQLVRRHAPPVFETAQPVP
jgi:hypothetical protein